MNNHSLRSTYLLLLLPSLFNLTRATPHDCYAGGPPFCNNSLTADPSCRGIETSSIDGWKRMDCDYALYNVPATSSSSAGNTDKWLIVHAGGCDDYTEDIGDWFSVDMGVSQFGIRPCGGFDDSECARVHGYDMCDALHISWGFPPAGEVEYAPYGLGFNPPALVDIYHTPNTTMLFLHEYGSTNASYSWFPADGCDIAGTKPMYVCVAALDEPSYADKFAAIKSTLEAVSGIAEQFPCRLEVIDAMPYAQLQQPGVPCTGIFREYNDPSRVAGNVTGRRGAQNWAWEMPGFVTRAVQLATEVDPEGRVVGAFKEAVGVALCREWVGGRCLDG